MMFNRKAPPSFRGLSPNLPLRIYTRNLPHWRQQGATYFVTFHLADALPAAKRNELASMRRDWEIRNPPPRSEATWTEYAQTVFRQVEKWMDAGHGKCWFRQSEYAAELYRTILHFHGERYEVGCFVIMANHCHLAIRPFESYELEDEIGSMKRISAIYVNKRQQIQEGLWQPESHDRIIRDEEHLYRVVQYIGANPQRSGVAQNAWSRWINPEWQDLGWDFQDET